MRCVAYTDGSYDERDIHGHKVPIYGSGVYLKLEDVLEPLEISSGDDNPEFAKTRNVAGELRAVVMLIQLLQNELPEYNEVEIYHDYEGVSKWVTGEWKAKQSLTQAYRDFMRKAQNTMSIKFVHVKGHSGVIYNERADRLARKGIDKHTAYLRSKT